MIRPCKQLIYLYYECSKCKYLHQELRFKEAKSTSSIRCPECDNVDKVDPITDIQIIYGKEAIVGQEKSNKTNKIRVDFEKRIKKDLIKIGYSNGESSMVAKVVTEKYGELEYEELVKKAIVEAVNINVKAN